MKRLSGIFARSDGASNVTSDNSEHRQKTLSPRIETEEGTMKEAKFEHSENDPNPSLRTVAGDSKVTVANSEHLAKQSSQMTRTDLGTCKERKETHPRKQKAGRLFKPD
jgi:hypothetical protein